MHNFCQLKKKITIIITKKKKMLMVLTCLNLKYNNNYKYMNILLYSKYL